MNQTAGHSDDARRRAADPATSQRELFELASQRPDLRPLIAENPNAYPGLLQWLGQRGDPQIDAALTRRRRSDRAEEPTQMFPPYAGSPQQPEADYGQSLESEPDQTTLLGSAAAEDSQQFGAAATPGVGPQATAGPSDGPVAGPPAGPPPGHYPAMPQSPGYPPQYVSAEEPEPQQRKRSGVGIFALIFLLVILLLAGLGAVYMLFLSGDDADEDSEDHNVEEPADPADQENEPAEPSEAETTQEPDTADPDESEEPEPSPDEPSPTDDETTEEDEEDAETRPAPDDAEDLSSFSSPSGNIHCQMDGNGVRCTIGWHLFDAPDGCEDSTTIRVTEEGEAEVYCEGALSNQPDELDYEDSATDGDFACTSTEAGVECWSISTGNGFRIAAEDYSFFEG